MATKNILKSKGIWGVIISCLGLALQHFNIDISESQMDEALYLAMQAYGLIQAFYGRVVAKEPITIAKSKRSGG